MCWREAISRHERHEEQARDPGVLGGKDSEWDRIGQRKRNKTRGMTPRLDGQTSFRRMG